MSVARPPHSRPQPTHRRRRPPALLLAGIAALLAIAAFALRSRTPPPATTATTTPALPTEVEAPVPGDHATAPATDANAPVAAVVADVPLDGERTLTTPTGTEAPTFAVFGIVRGADDAPRAGIAVHALPYQVAENFLRAGRTSTTSDHHPRTTTGADGRFHLQGLPAGTMHLYALIREDRRGMAGDPWAATEITGAAGETIEWNARLDPQPRIGGTLRDQTGAPLADTMVTATAGARVLRCLTDARGHFDFVCLPQEPHDLLAQPTRWPAGTPPAAARGVWPDRGEVELIAAFVAASAAPPGNVRGTVLDSGQRLRGRMAVKLVVDQRTIYSQPTIDGNAFAFADVAPGRGRAIVLAGNDPICSSDEFVVGSGQTIDLGTLVTTAAGTLLLRIERPTANEDASVTAHLTADGALVGQTVHAGTRSELTIDNLSPGVLSVRAWGDRLAHAETSVTITAGNTAAATVTLRAAAPRQLVVEYPDHAKAPRLRLRDAQGRTYLEATPTGLSPYTARVPLPLGQFTLLAELADGSSRQVEFSMVTLGADQPTVQMDVR